MSTDAEKRKTLMMNIIVSLIGAGSLMGSGVTILLGGSVVGLVPVALGGVLTAAGVTQVKMLCDFDDRDEL